MSIVVVGSLNLDRIYRVDRLPGAGETVSARGSVTRFGGKGANQAVAAARLGGRVSMIGAVGADDAGRAYLQRLGAEGIDRAGVTVKPDGVPTGSASIAIDANGENSIIVDPGANGHLTPDDVRAARRIIEGARVLVLQLEVPVDTTLEVLRIAREARVPVVFNPSPWDPAFPWQDVRLHTVIVNETEAKAWLGQPRWPAGLDLEQLMVTQGGEVTLGFTSKETVSLRPPRIKPVDTVGAGDTFAGAVAVALQEGLPLAEAIGLANAAGALATLAVGAQEGMPTRAAVDDVRRPAK